MKYVRFANLSLQVAGSLIGQDAALSVTLCFGAVFLECLDSSSVPAQLLELSSDVIIFSVQ